MNFLQHKKLKELKEKYSYDAALAKSQYNIESDLELLETLMIKDMDSKLVDSINEMLKVLDYSDAAKLVTGILAKNYRQILDNYDTIHNETTNLEDFFNHILNLE